jgi:twitching motility protein PilT
MLNKRRIDDILKIAVAKNASDIHIKCGVPPILRINRELQTEVSWPAISAEDAREILNCVTTDKQRKAFEETLELDFAFMSPETGRFRVNVYLQVGTISLVFRCVRTQIPSLEQLGLPEICRELALKREGLVILTGPTGCGKSSTLAAMLHYMNQSVKRNIVTIEDPIEFLHKDDKCTFSQREVGVDTRSFANALKHILRQDPDVILVGEMRDLETMSICLTAAETGHLILTTLHTPSSYGAIDRFIDAFPPYQHQQIRLQLSTTLQGIVYQNLIPRIDGNSLAAAVEVLIVTPAIRNLIREGKTFQMLNFMHSGQSVGMQTLDQSLVELYQSGKITVTEALSRMHSPENLKAESLP